MKLSTLLSLVAVSLFTVSGLQAQFPSALHKNVVQSDYGKLPLSFEANVAQTDEQVKFLSRGRGYALFLTSNEAVIALEKPASQSRRPKGLLGPKVVEPQKEAGATSAVLRMQLVAANWTRRVVGAEELPGKVNYFIGNDPSKWRTNVPTYAKVKYEGVYPGVDLVYYGNQGRLEYDFVVAPGADPNSIQLKFRGAGKLRVDNKGDLLLGAAGEEVRFQKPVVYQAANGKRKPVEGSYVMAAANSIGFRLGEYDHRQPLVIDPVLVYSTYLGGSGVFGNVGRGIAVDASGNAYVTGGTGSSNFPTANALQPTLAGRSNAFVTKINASGTALVYSTYLGGNLEDGGFGIAVDASGNAYVTGVTGSTNFPTVNALQATLAGDFDAFVTKINATGSALVYSTYLGGNLGDVGSGIAVDASGNAYVTGVTGSTNFPTANALQSTLGGSQNAFVTKINASGSALVYSTYLGGSGSNGDVGFGIVVDASGNAYVTGGTSSRNFPTANALQSTLGGSSNAFVTKINASGSALVYSTYLGGGGVDHGYGIAVDASGNAYVSGFTSSTNFPTANALQSTLGGSQNAFVTKINASGSALVYSTYLGGSAFDFGTDIAVDASGSVYVTGYSLSTNFPTSNAPQPTLAGRSNAFVTKISASGTALVYSTYLGGSGSNGDFGYGIAVDASGNAYVTGGTDSTDFPTANALQSTLAGPLDAFVAKIASQSLFAFVQRPINPDGSSVFKAMRGVVPVKFTLTQNDVPICTLPPATIAVTRTAGGTLGSVEESNYLMNADSGSNFRIDPTACQYIYNLAASSLVVGTYRANISIDGIVVGHAVFSLK